MSLVYNPTEILKRVAPTARLKKAVTKNLSLKRSALSTVSKSGVVSKKSVNDVALKVLRGYKQRVKAEAASSSLTESQLAAQIAKDPKQLINRVQNEVLFEIKESIKTKYDGTKFRWLPSSAAEPDPEHQAKYGEIFTIGVDEMPQDRYGCQCGMEILTDDESLEL